MEKLQIKAVGNAKIGHADKLRKDGQIPAVLYGHNVESKHLALSQNEFEKLFRKAGESTIVEVITDDGAVHNVLIQDVQKHYLTSAPIHVDFYEVKMTEKLTATVPLEFIGEADAVKMHGGTLVKVLNEVEVECLPGDLPHLIEVDISSLKSFDNAITVKDLKVSDKVEIKAEAEEMVAMVQPPRDVEAELQDQTGDIANVEGLEKADETATAESEEKAEA
jgi:large subunit ribosomal protein L25